MGRLLIRGEKGWELIPELGNTKEDHVIDKPGRSAFQHTEFGLMLNIRGLKNLVLCGVTTDVCVHSTMRDANDNAFDCAYSAPELRRLEPVEFSGTRPRKRGAVVFEGQRDVSFCETSLSDGFPESRRSVPKFFDVDKDI